MYILIRFLILSFLGIFLLTGCSSVGWNGWGRPHQQTYHEPDQSGVQTYRKPRKYNITQKDMQKYDAINDRVARRRAQIQQQISSDPITQKPSPAATDDTAASLPEQHYDYSPNL